MKGLESMSEKCLTELFSKDYIIYIIFRAISVITMVCAISMFIYTEINIVFNILFPIFLFIVSIYFTIKTNKLDVPKLAKCLNNSPIYLSTFFNLLIYIGFGLFVISAIRGFEDMNIIYIAIFAFTFGVSIYFYRCKKNKIMKERE